MTRTLAILPSAFLAATLVAGCVGTPGGDTATVASASSSVLRCWNGRCSYDWSVAVFSASPGVSGQTFGAPLYESPEQRMGIEPNECYITGSGGQLAQYSCGSCIPDHRTSIIIGNYAHAAMVCKQ